MRNRFRKVVRRERPPKIAKFGFPNGLPEQTYPNQTTTIHFNVGPGSQMPNVDSVMLHVSVNGNIIDVPSQHLGGESYTASIPAVACVDDVADTI